jgi:hypothetical protein
VGLERGPFTHDFDFEFSSVKISFRNLRTCVIARVACKQTCNGIFLSSGSTTVHRASATLSSEPRSVEATSHSDSTHMTTAPKTPDSHALNWRKKIISTR